MRTLALVVAFGGICGLAGYLTGTQRAPTPRSASPAREVSAADVEPPQRPPAGLADEAPATRPAPEPQAAAATIEDLVERYLAGEPVPQPVVDRARQLYEEDLATAAVRAARQAAREERDRRDVLQMEAAGEMPRLLEALASKRTTLPELAADGDRLLALLRAGSAGPTVSEPDLARLQSGEVVDGTTILLPRGRIRHPWRRSGKPFPAGLTFAGAGIEETFLEVEIDPDRPVLSLTFENMTVTSQDLVDAEKALTVILRNVRAAGYNTGAGGSNLMDIRSANFALYAEDCIFDGSVGRGGSQHGTPFSLSSNAKILRFTRCSFIENDTPVRTWGTATIHFEACQFIRNRRARVQGAVYRDCVFEGNRDDP